MFVKIEIWNFQHHFGLLYFTVLQKCIHAKRYAEVVVKVLWRSFSFIRSKSQCYTSQVLYIHLLWHKKWVSCALVYFGLRHTKGCLSLFHNSIDIRTAVNLFISCRKNVFLLENFNKNSFFLHEMDKLMAVLMSIEWWNKERQPLVQDSFELSWYLVCINLAKAIQSQPRRTFKRFSKHAHLPILGAPQLS